MSKNQFNMPTYFQLGRNSIENAERAYIQDPQNKGLIGLPRGKRQNIPVPANVLSKSDSSERLNLAPKTDSPQRKLAGKLRMDERRFKE